MKVYELAKELDIETITLMDKIKKWKLPVKSHMSSLSEDQIKDIEFKLKEAFSKKKTSSKKTVKKATKKVAKKTAKKTVKKATKKVAKKTAKKTAKKKSSSKKTSSKKSTTQKSEVKSKALKVNKKSLAEETESQKAVREIENKKSISKKTETKKSSKKIVAAKKKTGSSVKEEPSSRRMVIRRSRAEGVRDRGLTAEDLKKSQAKTQQENLKTLDHKSSNLEAQVEDKPIRKMGIKKTVITKKSIIGRMDLNQTKGESATKTSRQVSTRSRNLRTGFVAPTPMVPTATDESRNKKDDFKKKKVFGGESGDPGSKGMESPGIFKSADFRKREAVFQAKKKKISNESGRKTEITTPAAHKRVIKVFENMSVQDVAQEIGVKISALTKVLMAQGIMAQPQTILDFDTISLTVPEFNWEAQSVHQSSQDLEGSVAYGDLKAEPVLRAPVVTIMGHVDHGKTTLLDYIRKAKVVDGEAGGITQHIGAYRVNLEKDRVITFIDTPGHEAFTAMRSRGAHITDVVIIVVAADDGMMPQTQEAISHAQSANVPIIVAINKMDKEGANLDKIKQQLSEKELLPEDWGGSTIYVPISALKGEGIDALLENVSLVSEILDLKANPKRSGTGVVIESEVKKGRGTVITLLVQDGTVKKGDIICTGTISGRIRSMVNDQGQNVEEAGPGEPVEITGCSSPPLAGDRFDICQTEPIALQLGNQRRIENEKETMAAESQDKMSLENIFSKVRMGELKELPLILKADVAGSIEAIKSLIAKIESSEVQVKFIHTAVGGVSESDVLLAHASKGLIIGFNVRPDGVAKALAKEKSIEIKSYQVIYEIVDDVKKAMSGLLSPDIVEKDQGRAEVREIFNIPKVGVIAGSFVVDGKIQRSNKVRLLREGKIIYTGQLSSLKHFKDDAKEVKSSFECGIGIENYNDIKVGDTIEAFIQEEVARHV